MLAAVAGAALAAVPAFAHDETVGTRGERFVPAEVTIAPGEAVIIENTDGGFHNVKWEDRSAAEMLPGPGWQTTRRFDAPGSYAWICEPHKASGMRGTVVVQAGHTQSPTTPADTTPPAMTGARATATRRLFTLRVTLDEPARVAVRVLKGGRTVTRRTFSGRRGANRFRIRRAFPRGRLRARIVARDAAGNATRARSLSVRR